MFYLFVDVIFFIYCLTTGCPSPPFVFFIYSLFRDLYIIISFFYMVSVVFLYRFLYQVVSVRSSVTIFVIVVFYKKGVLDNFIKFTGKHLCQNLFLNKVAGLSYRNQSIDLQRELIDGFLYDRPATLFKKSLWHRCFPVSFAKFLRKPFLQITSGQIIRGTGSLLSPDINMNRG